MGERNRGRMIKLLQECIEIHREQSSNSVVLKKFIEDEEIQSILRRIIDRHGENAFENYVESVESPGNTDESGEMARLVDRLESRQKEIISTLDQDSD